jgi:hypothetical protein
VVPRRCAAIISARFVNDFEPGTLAIKGESVVLLRGVTSSSI